jgi:hypothetical protein
MLADSGGAEGASAGSGQKRKSGGDTDMAGGDRGDEEGADEKTEIKKRMRLVAEVGWFRLTPG